MSLSIKPNKFSFLTLLCLSALSLYSATTEKPYRFGKWVPTSKLQEIGFSPQFTKTLTTHSDLIVHFSIGFLATLLLIISFNQQLRLIKKTSFYLVIIPPSIALYSIVELVQLSIGRNFGLIDIIFGTLGTILSIFLFHFYASHTYKKTINQA